MPQSQNGWPVLEATQLRVWKIPDANGKPLRYRGSPIEVKLPLARGAAGWLLTFVATWWHERIELLTTQPQHDEWGWASRPIRGASEISNHASGTAIDLNATLHPLGVDPRRSLTAEQVRRIHRLEVRLRDCVRWGGDWSRPDGMHWEIIARRDRLILLVARLQLTPRGRRVRKANPWRKR